MNVSSEFTIPFKDYSIISFLYANIVKFMEESSIH